MIEINDSNLQAEILDAEKLAVLDFSSVGCQPCKRLEPILDELATEYTEKVVIGHCDVGQAPNTARQFGVMAVPTVVFFKGGKEVDRFMGAKSKEQVVELFGKHL
jgi:thioredoxin